MDDPAVTARIFGQNTCPDLKLVDFCSVTPPSSSSSATVVGTMSRIPLIGRGCNGTISSPARTASSTAQQPTLRASGPKLSSVDDSGTPPASGTRRCVGLKPTMPLKAAGIRHEPPVSVPSAPCAIRSATETAAPDDDPP